MLRYFAGLSVDETAAVLGVSASTVAAGVALREGLAGPPSWATRRRGQGGR